MRLAISHTTTYRYDEPVPYGLQELRLRPRSLPGQTVLDWDIHIDGGTREVMFDDEYSNIVELMSLDADVTETTVSASGIVDTEDTSGVIRRHLGHAPLWFFERTTPLTTAGDKIADLIGDLDHDRDGSDVGVLHELSQRILSAVAYESGTTHVTSTAEEAFESGHGVCQDHSHIFIAAARAMGYPARYISGYLMLDGGVDQDASHAWAQAWVEALGWVGFDVSNGISPDERYVQVATGLDYRAAAPVSGVRFGSSGETMQVSLQVQQ